MPPWAQRVVDWSSSPLVMTPTRVPPRCARRTAADRPATPLPTTRTSRRWSPVTTPGAKGGAGTTWASMSWPYTQVVDQADLSDAPPR